MFSLVIWKIITPYFKKIKYSIPLSIILGLLIGLSNLKGGLANFSIGRTIAFYPFFLVGYYCTKDQFYKYKNKINKYVGIIGFIAVILIGIAFINSIEDFLLKEKYINKALYLKDTYKSYFINENIGIFVRFNLYIIQFACIILFCSFIPSKKTIFSKIAMNSLFIYLSHGMIIKYMQRMYFKDLAIQNGDIVIIISAIISILYCLLLSTKYFSKIGSLLTSIKVDRFLNE